MTTQLLGGSYPKVVDRVTTITTPGETIDALITEAGVAVNPRRADLRERLLSAKLTVIPIERLREEAERRAGGARRKPEAPSGRIVGVVEYRDGTVIDVVRQMADQTVTHPLSRGENSDLGSMA